MLFSFWEYSRRWQVWVYACGVALSVSVSLLSRSDFLVACLLLNFVRFIWLSVNQICCE